MTGQAPELAASRISQSFFSGAAAGLELSQQSFLGVTGHLATITSASEDTFLYHQVMLPNIAAPDVYHDAWLGGYQLAGAAEPSGGWNWVTGESWTYSAWNLGEPNNGAGYGFPAEDVLAYKGSGGWNDEPRDFSVMPNAPAPVGYLVEFDVPEPGAVTLLLLGGGAFMALRRRK